MCERHGREEEPALKGGPVWRGAIVDESGSCTEGARRAKAAHVAVRDVLRATPPPFHPGLGLRGLLLAHVVDRRPSKPFRHIGISITRPPQWQEDSGSCENLQFSDCRAIQPEEARDESKMSGDRKGRTAGHAATPTVFGRDPSAPFLHLHIFHRSRIQPLAGPPVFRVGGRRLRRKRGARCSRGAAPVRRASALQACGPCHDGQSCHRIKALTHARSANVMQTG